MKNGSREPRSPPMPSCLLRPLPTAPRPAPPAPPASSGLPSERRSAPAAGSEARVATSRPDAATELEHPGAPAPSRTGPQAAPSASRALRRSPSPPATLPLGRSDPRRRRSPGHRRISPECTGLAAPPSLRMSSIRTTRSDPEAPVVRKPQELRVLHQPASRAPPVRRDHCLHLVEQQLPRHAPERAERRLVPARHRSSPDAGGDCAVTTPILAVEPRFPAPRPRPVALVVNPLHRTAHDSTDRPTPAHPVCRARLTLLIDAPHPPLSA